MPAKNFLSSETKEKLQKALKEHEHPEIRERVLMLLLLDDGNTQKHIAELIGCSLSKVAYWCVHGDPDNLDSLSDERMKGNYRKATEEYIKLLLEIIEIEPKEYGDESGFSLRVIRSRIYRCAQGNRSFQNITSTPRS